MRRRLWSTHRRRFTGIRINMPEGVATVISNNPGANRTGVSRSGAIPTSAITVVTVTTIANVTGGR